MEGLKKGILVKNNVAVGAVGDKYFSTCPIGTVLSFAGQTAPHGYLLCNGASYPTADYPDLYAVIGNTYGGDTENFNVPDYRETVLVGVGENTTDTIASHDVYELGEFKDDQLQRITGDFESGNRNTQPHTSGAFSAKQSQYTWFALSETKTPSSSVEFDSSKVTRSGTTTHGKQKGVTYIIKAFHTNEGVDSDGISDEYSTYEIKTNKVWIDGKPIYRKVINFGTLPNNNVKKVSHGILNIDTFVSINGITFTIEKTATALPYAHSDSTNEVSLFIEGTNVAIRTFGNKTNYIKTYVTLEYTKTTDA